MVANLYLLIIVVPLIEGVVGQPLHLILGDVVLIRRKGVGVVGVIAGRIRVMTLHFDTNGAGPGDLVEAGAVFGLHGGSAQLRGRERKEKYGNNETCKKARQTA